MLVTQDNANVRYQIRAYEPGRIRINEQWYSQPLLLTAESMQLELLPTALADLTTEHVRQICAGGYEVILLGTGARQQFLPVPLMLAVQTFGRTIDVMDTRAAAHTFVVLAAEGRKVIAALYP